MDNNRGRNFNPGNRIFLEYVIQDVKYNLFCSYTERMILKDLKFYLDTDQKSNFAELSK